jgi:GTP-binding protein Era
MMTTADEKFRCGFVAIIGAPNAGKSTLINHLVGAKVTIVSSKVQTTRMRVRGIMMRGLSQVVLVDTPGIFSAKRRLDRAMVAAAWEGEQDADITALIIDASRKDPAEHVVDILEKLNRHARVNAGDVAAKKPVILILNKIDQMPREKLLPLAAMMNEKHDFSATFMISAETGSGVEDLARWFAKMVPEGVHLFPEDEISDLPARLLAAEITREKIFHMLHDELPYGMTVETESWEEFDNGDAKISQVIIISRDAHKPIVLGKGGAQIKKIGQRSREELEKIFDRKVHLNLIVRVRENWMDDPERYSIWGLDPKA